MALTRRKALVALATPALILPSRSFAWSRGTPFNHRQLVAQGDSITATSAGPGPTYVDFYDTEISCPLTYHNIAGGGMKLASVIGQVSAVDTFNTPGKTNVLSILIGTNDIGTPAYYPSGSAAWLSDLFAYTDGRRTLGYKVLVCTILPRSAASGINPADWVPWRNAINSGILGAVGTHIDAACNYDLDPNMADPTNTTYYSDGLHPTLGNPPSGQRSMQNDFTPICNSLFGL